MPPRRKAAARASAVEIPAAGDAVLDVDGREVRLTNLDKPFWPDPLVTKGDLLRYYQAVAPCLLPHIADRAMVMKRYPHGAAGEFFFMKRAPTPRPDWIETVSIDHGSKGVIDFPVISDLPSLLWVINLGCIDLNPWYARTDDVDRPDYVHFDLDPGEKATWAMVVETAALLHDALERLRMPSFVKTSGSKGLHVYVPIVRGPTQKEVWTLAKALAFELARQYPHVMTSVYRIADRPKDRVLVDYNQNAWGRTLASIYSVRPKRRPTVSMPVTWKELAKGVEIDDFDLWTAPRRLKKVGDLWAGVVSYEDPDRFDLRKMLG
jgi:bifunctional non-homologous end joining protein LigD